nr:DUF922 domain-containing protein [uncultured Gellertiella sp.]
MTAARLAQLALSALLLALPVGAEAGGVTRERIVTYPIHGQSGIALYRDIGLKGPVVAGSIRAIAHTGFKLTWTRRYENRDGACVLASAVPRLTITYTLPRPANPLPSPTAENWQTFLDGIARHERGHGDLIRAMVKDIEQASIGLTVANDPGCRRIRTELTRRLGALSRAEQKKSNGYDRAEMGRDGNIPRLVLALVNGG